MVRYVYPFIFHRIHPKNYFADNVWYENKCAKCVEKFAQKMCKLHNKGDDPSFFCFFLPNMKRERWMIPKTAPNCAAEAPLASASIG